MQAEIYNTDIAPHIKKGASLVFAHGFNVHFQLIEPRADLDVWMRRAQRPGHTVRGEYQKAARSLPRCRVPECFGQCARPRAFLRFGSRRRPFGIIETNFKEECETDLFGEQAVRCGGITHLIQAGLKRWLKRVTRRKWHTFECLHETKLIVDLIYGGRIANMRYSISNTARIWRLRGPARASSPTKPKRK